MAKAPPAFQFYAADFATATSEWSNAEVGAYLRLLIHQWITGDVPLDEDLAARICAGERDGLAAALGKFVPVEGTNGHRRGWNLRLEQVREASKEYRRKQSEKAKEEAANRERDESGRFR